MKRYFLILVTVLIGALLAGCGDEEEPPQLEGVRLEGTPTEAATPTPAPPETLAGSLVFVQGDSLYVDRLSDDAPAALAVEHFPSDTSFYFDEDQTGMLYSVQGERPLMLHYLDLATLEVHDIKPLANTYWMLQTWLPDDRFIVRSMDDVLSLASLGEGDLGNIPGYNRAYPLAEGGVLLLNAVYDSTTLEYTYTAVARFDPGTQTVEPVDLEPETLNRATGSIVDLLAAEGFALAIPESAQGQQLVAALTDVTRGRSEPCDSWQILQLEPLVNTVADLGVVATMQDVYAVSDARRLPDGSLVWVETLMPDCRMSLSPVRRLVMLQPDAAEPEVIAEDVTVGGGLNRGVSYAGMAQAATAVSPSGRYLAWIAGGMEPGYSAVEVLDVETGQRFELLRAERGPGSDSNFLNAQMITSIDWVPAEAARNETG